MRLNLCGIRGRIVLGLDLFGKEVVAGVKINIIVRQWKGKVMTGRVLLCSGYVR